MIKHKLSERPFVVRYIREGSKPRELFDSAPTLEIAKWRISHRLANPRNRAERAEVHKNGVLVFSGTISRGY